MTEGRGSQENQRSPQGDTEDTIIPTFTRCKRPLPNHPQWKAAELSWKAATDAPLLRNTSAPGSWACKLQLEMQMEVWIELWVGARGTRL